MSKYYSLKKILKYKALYNMIIGQRSNGKTYSVIDLAIERFFKYGYKSAYIRRLKEDLRPTNLANLVTPHLDKIIKLSKGKYNKIRYYRGEFSFIFEDEKGEVLEKSDTFIKTFSLNTWESSKGADNGYFDVIIFDEFLTRDFYLRDEFIVFTQILSSLLRDRDGSIIFMIANTVNKFCPYFSEMGLYNITKQKQGTIDLYSYGDSGLTVAVEYCKEYDTSSTVSKYFAFNNPRLQMITSGAWELALYPHCPVDYAKQDIIGHCYIKFNSQLVHGEIVYYFDVHDKQEHLFVFFYQQTKETPIQKIECMFTDEEDSNILHVQSIADTPTKLHKLVIDLIRENRDFYATNEVGEIVRNWKIEHSLT